MLTAENWDRRYTVAVKRYGATMGGGYALLIALIPIVMMYQVPVADVGLSTALVAATMPYAAFKAISANKRVTYKIIFPMVLYCCYVMARSSGNNTNILLTVAIVVHLSAAASGAVHVSYARKVVEIASITAAVAVMIQSVAYYLFNFHLPMIAGNCVLDAMKESYRIPIATGIAMTENLYRPSAFFLEPAHLAQYTIVGLISCLFQPRPKYRTAAVISLGTLLSTSGMGMVLVVFGWGVHSLGLLRAFNMKKNVTRFLLVLIVALIATAVLSQSSVMQSTVARFSGGFFLGSTSEYNAIWGRTLFWKKYIAPLNGSSLVWGMGFSALPAVYFTGLMEILFCYGYVGVGLFYFAVIRIIINTFGFARWVAIVVGGLMPIANLSSFLSFIYFFGILYASWGLQIKGRLPIAGSLGIGRGTKKLQ
jgi:hypothetical protein